MPKQNINEEIAYTFYKYTDTDEIHIFEGKFIPDDNDCTAKTLSICKKVDRYKDPVRRLPKCLNEDEARAEAAKRGRVVCGICVSSLYTTDY